MSEENVTGKPDDADEVAAEKYGIAIDQLKEEAQTRLVSKDELWRLTKLSRTWLHEATLDERIPSLKVGPSRYYNYPAVQSAIFALAAGQGAPKAAEEAPTEDF